MPQSQSLHPIQALWWETADKILKTWQWYVSRMQNLEMAIHFITMKKKLLHSKFLRGEDMQTHLNMGN